MALPNYLVRSEYVGTGALAAYTFDFKIASLEHLIIVQSDDNFLETFHVRGSDTTYISSVVFDSEVGGGTVILAANLPNLHNLAILLANDEPLQESEFKNKSDFTLKRFEDTLDVQSGAIQRLAYLCKRALKFTSVMLESAVDAFNTEVPIPEATKVLAVNDTGTGFKWIDNAGLLLFGTGQPLDSLGMNGQYYIDTDGHLMYGPKAGGVWPLPGFDLGGSGGGVPVGGATGAALVKASAADGDAVWEPFVYSGFSSRFGAVAVSGLKNTIDFIMSMTRLAPTISLSASGGSGTVREVGTVVAGTTLSALVGKTSDPIANVRFYLSPATLINTVASPNPAGGTETYSYPTSFSTTTSFYAQVDDDGSTGGPSTTTSNTVTFTFLYPYYWGNGAPGKTPAQVAALTKVVANRPSGLTYTANNDVFYLAYPATSAALTSIKDVMGFETIGDWTYSTGSIVGLDATSQTYRIYEFNNIVTPGSFPYTFS